MIQGSEEQGKKEIISLDQALREIELKFFINLPPSELNSPNKLFFQIEQAHWFYEDFIVGNTIGLETMTFREFSQHLFACYSFLQPHLSNFDRLLSAFFSFKGKIPFCGGILLNPEMTKIFLVRDYNDTYWSFPGGKINQDEGMLECAVREVWEECGLDCSPYVNEEDAIEVLERNRIFRLYIVANVPEDYNFHVNVRKEISRFQWFSFDECDQTKVVIYQAILQLKEWIKRKKEEESKDFSLMNHGIIENKVFASNRETKSHQFVNMSQFQSRDSLTGKYMENIPQYNMNSSLYDQNSIGMNISVPVNSNQSTQTQNLNNLIFGDDFKFDMQELLQCLPTP